MGIRNWQERKVTIYLRNHIDGVMVSMLQCGRSWVWAQLGQTKVYKISICCFSAKYKGVRVKIGWLRIRIMCLNGTTYLPMDLFQWANTIKILPWMLVLYKADIIIISLTCNLFSTWYSWQIVHLALNNNHSLSHQDRYCMSKVIYFCYSQNTVLMISFSGIATCVKYPPYYINKTLRKTGSL